MPFIILKMMNKLTNEKWYKGFNSPKQAKSELEKLLRYVKKYNIVVDVKFEPRGADVVKNDRKKSKS